VVGEGTSNADGRVTPESAENEHQTKDVHQLVIDELRAALGSTQVLVDADVRFSYETDWSRRWTGEALCVARPGTTDEVSAVLRVCHRYHVPCVPQGGRTGLVGGNVPTRGEVVMNLERLNQIGPLDADAGQVSVGAGVTLATLQEVAASVGWRFGVDLASRDSATVGGMIATNAGGVHVLRYGQMRDQVISLECVLADGAVLRGTGSALKDNAGYDLAQIIIGSEGTLGVVTSARVKLVAPDVSTMVSLVGVGELANALEMIGRCQRASLTVAAAEFLDNRAMTLVCAHLGIARPVVESPWYAVVEFAGPVDPIDIVVDVLADCPGVADDAVAIGYDRPSNRRLWRYREAVTESIARSGVAHKFDVGLAPESLDEFARDVRTKVASTSPSATVVLFGHLAEGNVHVNVLDADPEEGAVDEMVLRLVAQMGGNVAAEHGVGRAKAAWLHLSRSSEEIRTMRAIKLALDPSLILSPGVVFDLGTLTTEG
jgi:FAD/FMN-containing dehydrogenase